MKKLLLTSVAALFLATGTAHAKDDNTCVKPNIIESSCSTDGDQYDCDNEFDSVYIRNDHRLSDLSSHTITIYTPLGRSRDSKRYPVVRYDVETGKLTMNGKRCRRICREGCE